MHAHTVDNLELNLKVPSPRQTLFITQYTTYLLISKNWGSGTEYKKVCVYETSQRIIGPAINCVLVGKPFFRNLEFLDTAMAYAQAVPLTATILRFVWEPLRPLAVFFATIPICLYAHKMEKLMLPEIQRRLAADEARQRDRDGHKPMDPEPNDSLQWSIRQAKQMGDPYLWSPTTLTVRVMILDFAALHTTSFAITHALLDLAAPKQKYIDALRDEVQSVLAEHGGEWNKRALAQMVKVDSVLRESQQLNSPVSVGLTRNVTAKEEIITPSGVKIPYGATVCVPGFTVMHDDEVYEDAETFRPFRFAEQRREDSVEYVERANKSFPTTSCECLAFGHGRNACPGRFFAANELKLILAYAVLNYDIEVTPGKRPRNEWIGQKRIPPFEATIRIRKSVVILAKTKGFFPLCAFIVPYVFISSFCCLCINTSMFVVVRTSMHPSAIPAFWY